MSLRLTYVKDSNGQTEKGKKIKKKPKHLDSHHGKKSIVYTRSCYTLLCRLLSVLCIVNTQLLHASLSSSECAQHC